VALAANRDEEYGREFDPPSAHPGPVPFAAPRDRRAGGTWLGVNARGLVAAVTNRPARDPDPRRRSRGLLCSEVLAMPGAVAAREALDRHLRGALYNNFQLLVADAAAAFVVRYTDGWAEVQDLEPGEHVYTNEDDPDAGALPALGAKAGRGAREEAERLARLLPDHEPRLPGGRAPCRHHEGRGTVSASALALPEEGPREGVFLFAGGPPCRTAWEDFSPLLRGL